MKVPAARPLPVVLLLALLMLSPGTASTAQVDPDSDAADETLIVESTLDLTDGERTWMTLHRSTIADDDPPIDAREGVLYAIDAPLMLLYEGQSRIDRIPQGKALALREGDKVRPVAMQAGPASLLAVGLTGAGAPVAGDPYQPVGEPFALPAGTYVLELHRYDLATRPGGTVPAIQQQIGARPYPALIYIERGEVTVTPAGQSAPASLKQHDLATVDGSAGLIVSDDGAVILVVTLTPMADAAATGGTGVQVNSNTAQPGAPSPTPSTTAEATASTTATVMPTSKATVTSAPDADGDGLSDAAEAARGTNPNSNDSDGDGVFDGYEVSVGLDPLKPDTDGDGVSDYDEVGADTVDPGSGDADGDGLTDGYEGQVSLTDPNDADSDHDGLSDGQEVTTYGSNPLSADTDGDGLSDGADVAAGASPTNRDTDGDGLSDAFEVNQGTSPAAIDSDGDGVDDGYETGRGMNPLSGDSDGDGLGDGEEVNTWGTNPLNPDSDADDHSDGLEVGCGQDPNTYTDYTGVVAC